VTGDGSGFCALPRGRLTTADKGAANNQMEDAIFCALPRGRLTTAPCGMIIPMRQAYFMTSTVNHWISLFHRDELAGIMLEALFFRVKQGQIKINAYVIMPNHTHMIATINDGGKLSDFLRDFHKFTAKRIIGVLEKEDNPALARFTVENRDRKIQIWRKTHSPKQIASWEFFREKLEYIHNNPVTARWRLCDRPEDFAYSSARDYILGQQGALPVEVITPWTPW